MTTVRTIITAAGDSRGLFLPAGFSHPKSLVKWEGREVIAHAIDSYATDLTRTAVAIHAGEDNEWAIGDAVKRQFPEVAVARVPAGAQGALASALIALSEADDAPLVVAAGDSMVSGGIGRFIDDFSERGLSAATIAFESQNPRWSYLSVDPEGTVQQVAEKQVIGPLATTGVFYFQSSLAFVEAATWCLVNNASYREAFYVSTTLNWLVSTGQRVGYGVIDRSEYRSWSLPVDFTAQST